MLPPAQVSVLASGLAVASAQLLLPLPLVLVPQIIKSCDVGDEADWLPAYEVYIMEPSAAHRTEQAEQRASQREGAGNE